MTRTAILTTALLAALVALPRPARAADVSVSVSAREVFVGVPFTLQVAIDNAREREQPQLPELVGVEVVGEPSESSSSFTQIINGRMTQRETVTVSYRLVATRAGPFTIGPITVVADGQTLRTTPIRMVATVSETGDLLFLDVTSARDTYYVGETIELTLEIWLKPFHDRRTNRRLDAQEMWRQVDGRATTLGLFADRSEDITVRPALRADAEGIEREYFVYALRSRFAPRQAGLLAFDDVRVVVRYPLELQRRRSFFESGWEVSRSRPIVGTIERSAIEVLAPPREGRPPSFTGAVGTFDIEVSAKPIDVSVGDPVTLTMTITDRTPVGTKLEGLRPPDLNAVPGLSERFRIPRIPPIPFAYFDPLAGRYVTVSSDPIALSVAPSANISMDDVVGFEPGNGAGPTELTEVAGGILANYSGPELLVSQQVTAGTWVHGAAVLTPPVLFGVVAIGSRRARRL
ncbi:MAG: BatD family protein, partial [Planctomycetota bacterium]